MLARNQLTPMHRTSAKPSHSAKPLARVRPRRKRNEDGGVPPKGLVIGSGLAAKLLISPDVSKCCEG